MKSIACRARFGVRRVLSLKTAAVSSFCISLAAPVLAQEPSTGQLASPGQLEEIVVTAQRREENLQTVPMVVTVVSQQKLEQNNVQTIEDLQYLVPSMTSTSTFSRDSSLLSIRGQEPSETSNNSGSRHLPKRSPHPNEHQRRGRGPRNDVRSLECPGAQGTTGHALWPQFDRCQRYCSTPPDPKTAWAAACKLSWQTEEIIMTRKYTVYSTTARWDS